jgi:hypothetical protein
MVVAAVLLVLLLWWGRWLIPSAAYHSTRKLQEEWFREASHSEPPEERMRKWDELYKRFSLLTDAERAALMRQRREHFARFYAEFPSWPWEKQIRYLDEEIDLQQVRQRELLARKGGKASSGDESKNLEKDNKPTPTPEPPRQVREYRERENWRRQVLDSVPAEERLQRDLYFQMLLDRKRERGMVGPPSRP